jgi:hypothetical protein
MIPERVAMNGLAAVLTLLPTLSGCATRGDAPTLVQIANATYTGVRDEPVRLVDGRYEGPPFVAGGASRPTVTLLRDRVAFGDLDADGVDEALVVLVAQAGGSGSFVYLSVIATRAGEVSCLDTVPLGDRVRVRSLSVLKGGIVSADLMEHAPGDAACCPSLETRREWSLRA